MSTKVKRATVTLDLDGVLIQNPFDTYVVPAVLGHLEQSGQLVGLGREEARRELLQAIDLEWQRRMDRRDFAAAYHWDDIYSAVGQAYGVRGLPDVTRLVEEGAAQGHVHTLPGAHQALQLLRDAGLRTVALTNGYRRYQWPVLEVLGLAPLFDEIRSPEAHGYAKPQPEFFSDLGEVLAHVGDRLEHDVLGANLAGIRAVWIVPELPGPDLVVEGAALAGSDFATFFDRMQRNSPYLRHHPEATGSLLTPWLAVRNVLDGVQAIVDRRD